MIVMMRSRAVAGAAALAVAALIAVVALPFPSSMMVRTQVLGPALAFAVCLQLSIDAADGSRPSIGNTVAIALATLLDPGMAVAVTVLAIIFTFPVSVFRLGRPAAVRALGWAAAASGVAIASHAAASPAIDAVGMHGDVALLSGVVAAGAGFLAVELGLRWVASGRHRATRYASGAHPVASIAGPHVAILCAAALLVLGSGTVGGWAALVAAVPLLIIHFSFGRYARARQTYDQAVRALSIVPEVAGYAPLGHGERTAFYAAALTRSLQVGPVTAEAIVTAARIHHLGRVLDDQGESGEHHQGAGVGAGASAAELLSEISFLAGVADLVADVEAAQPGEIDLRCAIVRVASTFDDLTADSGVSMEQAATRLLARHCDVVEHAVALDLVQLYERQPALVLDAYREGSYPPPADLSYMSRMSSLDHRTHSEETEIPS